MHLLIMIICPWRWPLRPRPAAVQPWDEAFFLSAAVAQSSDSAGAS